jgi:hypothetical protein
MNNLLKLKRFIGKVYRWLKRESLKMFKKIRYKIWLSIKQISFKSREEKLKIAEKILRENSNHYFTTELVKTGFTDQLIGFNFLYKSGKGLGLKYYHTPLSAHRSSDPFLFDPITQNEVKELSENKPKPFDDIFDFLGINDYLEDQSAKVSNPRKQIPIDLNVLLYGREGINSYESLLEEMKVVLYPFLKKSKEVILCFKAEPRTYFSYYQYVHNHSDHEIDYYNCFKQSGKKDRWHSEFEPNTTNMLVHIRQGDTGTIETPWNTYIPVWHEIEGKFTQFKNERDIPGTKRMYPKDFYKFVKDLQQDLAIKKLSTAVFSDGYKKAFRWIYLYFKEKDISIEQIEKLKEMEPTYDEVQFGKFNDLENTHTVIGEEVEKLYSLVQSFFDADIIVSGTQALMMPKFMATYGKRDAMPFLIFLYHTTKRDLDLIGFKESDPFVMFVDIENYNISEVSNRISTYLEFIGKV